MKSTENFKKVISQHLEVLASNDTIFAETLKKEKKNIDDCVNYILTTVQASKCNGFTDDEIFGMAVHYYDEDDIIVGKTPAGMQYVVNHKAELTEEEIQQAKQQAMDKVIADEKERIKKKVSPKKEEQKVGIQASLF
jgi:transcription antitermination factor NusG